MNSFRIALAAGALAASAGTAMATTTDLTFNGFAAGSKNVNIHFESDTDPDVHSAVAAGGFSMTGTNPVETFTAWCLDIFTRIKGGPETYSYQSFLTDGQAERVQKVFDANYSEEAGGVLSSSTKSAAFQISLWDAAYDTDWDAGAYGGGTTGFKITQYGYSSSTFNAVLAQANTYLSAAKLYDGLVNWSVVQLDSDAAQSLVKPEPTSPVPAPLGLLLIGSAFGGAGILSGLRRRLRG